jgi:hypothetical protein
MPIATSSLKRYEAMRKIIQEKCGENYTPQQAIDYVKATYPNVSTQNGYFASLRHFALGTPDEAVYSASAKAIRAEKDSKEKSQTLPEKRAKKMLTWPELQEAYTKAKELCESGKLNFEKFLLIALYTQIDPIRADWSDMEYITDIAQVQPNKNYCLLGSMKTTTVHEPTPSTFAVLKTEKIPGAFILQDYKSSKRYGRVDIPIPDHLEKILYRHWNLGGFGGNKYVYSGSSNSLCHAVSRAFETVTGKPTTVSLIRHARIDAFYKTDPTIGEKEDLARKMLHSPAVGERYRTAVGTKAQ